MTEYPYVLIMICSCKTVSHREIQLWKSIPWSSQFVNPSLHLDRGFVHLTCSKKCRLVEISLFGILNSKWSSINELSSLGRCCGMDWLED